MRGLGVVAAGLMVTVVFAGCLSETATNLGLPDPEELLCADATSVDKRLGRFSYGEAASCKSGNETYGWSTAMPRANVDWGGTYKGSVKVTILDSVGVVVYEHRLDGTSAEGASGSTDYGVPGPGGGWTWTVNVEFRNFTGTMGLNVESSL